MADQRLVIFVKAHRRDFLLIALLFLGSFLLLCFYLQSTRFDGLYGQDSYAYYDFGAELRVSISEGRAPGAFFWPLGYPALLAIVQALFGTQPEIGQTVNLLMGATLAPLVYVLARQMGADRRGALIAGILMAICGQALQSSLVLMADIPALFWALLSAVLLWGYFAKIDAEGAGSIPSILLSLAALTLALASITRWLYLILIVPWALTLLIVWRGRIRWRQSLFALFATAIVLLPQFVYSQTSPYPVLNHAWVEGWSPVNAFRHVFDNADGHFEYAKINALYYAQPFYDPYYLAPVFTPFLLVSIAALYRSKRYAVLVMLLGWVLLPYLFLAGIPYQNIRFPLIVFPAVAILAGFGLTHAADWLQARVPRPQFAQLALWGLVLLGVTMSFIPAQQNINTFLANQQRDKHTAAWAKVHIPVGGTVYTLGLTLTLKHYTPLNVVELYYETPDSLAKKWIPGKHDFLLVNVWDIQHQWVGRAPEIAFNWLWNTRRLKRLGRFQYYTLYRIEG